MKEYEIKYSYNGYGSCNIRANSKEEAEDKFYEGDYDINQNDTSESNYWIEDIEKI